MAAVYFILLLGGLIFFHELGHFVLARAMGVHVVTFSIGFGPPLFKIKGRKTGPHPPTEYVVAALPLGGYVKMLGDDPGEDLPDEQRAVSFSHKPVWRRFLIVSAGPAFNLILPYFIYFFVGVATAQQTPSWIGMVDEGGPAARAGILAGDTITSIDGEEVRYWWQVQKIVSERPGVPLQVTVQRDGAEAPVAVELTPEAITEQLLPGLDLTDEVGRVGVAPVYMRPYVAVIPGSPAWEAGLRSGDRLTAVAGQPVTRYMEALARLQEAGDAPVAVRWVRYAGTPEGGLASPVSETAMEATVPAGGALPRRGVASLDCLVTDVMKGSPAAELGLAPGDVVLALDGAECTHWGFVESTLMESGSAEHTLTWAHQGRVVEETRATWIASVVQPAPTDPDRTVLTFGARTERGVFAAPDPIPNDHRVLYAVTTAIDRTHDAIRMNVAAITGLFAGSVPLKELSGPIGIAQLASQTSERGWGYFFSLMVWLSISLGLINLLPIPVLDGGHILFLGIEAVRRRPVSLRTRMIATYIGLAFIILLFVLVIKNDIERPWG